MALATGNNVVTELALTRNEITDRGAAVLASVLASTRVVSLDLGSNKVGDSGAAAIARILAGGGSNNSTITWLSLDNNLVGVIGARELASRTPLVQFSWQWLE